MRKTSNVGIWIPFWEVKGDARPWLMARWKAHSQVSIRRNWTFFVVCHSSRVMKRICSARLFSQRVDLFALKFYLDRVVSHQPFLASENKRQRATRWRRPHPSAFPRFDTIPDCDGRTDGRKDGFAVAYTIQRLQRYAFHAERYENGVTACTEVQKVNQKIIIFILSG